MSRPLPTSMLHVLHDQAARMGDRPALWSRRGGYYLPTSWRDYAARVKHFALGLHRLGFGRGDVLAVLAFNREEWVVAQLAAMALGGVAVGLYTTSSSEQLAYVLGHCEASIALVESEAALQRLLPLRPGLPRLRALMVMDPPPVRSDEVPSFAEVLQGGMGRDEGPYWEAVNGLQPDQLGTLIYTSGTTGDPKGVMLSHRNLVWTARTLIDMGTLEEGEILLSYLPLSHIAEQLATVHCALTAGMQVYFAQSLEKLADDLREVRPTVFFGVPRVYEKLRARAEARLQELPGPRRAMLQWAREVTLRRNLRALAGEHVPPAVEAQYQVAKRTVLVPLKERIGLDRARILVTSAAPIGKDVLEFFASVDLILREIYGQSEVTGPTSSAALDFTCLGGLGRPLLGVEVRIAPDGEILVRGPNVCLGYYRDPQGTAELLKDGWLHSGDLGALEPDGQLRVTGRKKEIIVTSGGKKTAPAAIEAMLKALPPLGNAMLVGEGRRHLVALVPLDPERVPAFARERGWPEDPEQLAAHPAFLQDLERRIEAQVNAKVARFETVKRFAVLARDFSVEEGELTPTLKLRRTVIEARHAARIDALYGAAAEDYARRSMGT
ncbi:MAG TPA: long-chain fatty acid--CoA ligase [Myxococcaceae bacterium]|nr:long-chain fatty acid--CoA ligase [Myxococcaceae bacterium]